MFSAFFYLLRAKGLDVSLNEWLMLMEALEKDLAHSSLTSFYYLARSILVKSETEYDMFDGAFLEFFKDIFFEQRERILKDKKFDHPRFRYAWQFKEANKIVIAAPFWDLSFPALLKVYIENLCVDGITFGCNENGCFGTCNADKLVYITTRGGIYSDSPLEMGARYIEAMCEFFGIENFKCICAEGIDVYGVDAEKIMNDAMREAENSALDF